MLSGWGEQCANIARLARLPGREAPEDNGILDAIERMGQLARSRLSQGESFAARDVALARDLVDLEEVSGLWTPRPSASSPWLLGSPGASNPSSSSKQARGADGDSCANVPA